MELLDIYDEKGNHIGKEDRSIVHRDALWHKTVHCWLYDKEGNVFFQIRADRGTLYTTASGHLNAGETIEEGFEREIKEEIGIEIDAKDATKVNVIPFKMDRIKEDGSIFKDRAFANIYVDLYEGNYQDFKLDPKEVSGLALVSAKEVFSLFNHQQREVKGHKITCNANETKVEDYIFKIDDFLVNEGETLLGKYGEILEKIIFLTKHEK